MVSFYKYRLTLTGIFPASEISLSHSSQDGLPSTPGSTEDKVGQYNSLRSILREKNAPGTGQVRYLKRFSTLALHVHRVSDALPPPSALTTLCHKGCTRPNVTIGDSTSDSAKSENSRSGFDSITSRDSELSLPTSIEPTTQPPVPSDPATLQNEGCTRSNVSIGDSAISLAISENSRSGFISGALNDPDFASCSSVESTDLSPGLSVSETTRRSPHSLLAESIGPVRSNCRPLVTKTPCFEIRNRQSPTAFEAAWRSLSLTHINPAIVLLVTTVGFFTLAAIQPIFATLFPVFAKHHHNLRQSLLLESRTDPADFLAVPENSCDQPAQEPSNLRRSFPHPVAESTEQALALPDLGTCHEVAFALFANSSIVVRASEPRSSDPRTQDPRCVTEIADTIIESAIWHQKELNKTVFDVTNPSTNSRTSRYRSRSLPSISSPIRLKGFGPKVTSSSAILSVSSVAAGFCHPLSTIPLAPNPGQSRFTGGKGWCPDPVHHKYIARKWIKNLPNTHLEYSKDIQNFPSQFN